jgi:hypothetical protein
MSRSEFDRVGEQVNYDLKVSLLVAIEVRDEGKVLRVFHLRYQLNLTEVGLCSDKVECFKDH